MNTQEIYKKRIEKKSNTFVKHAVSQGNGHCTEFYARRKATLSFKEGANFILNNLWISVEEALPEENGRYLVYAPTYEKGSSSGLDFKDGIGFSRFCNGKWSIEIGYHKRPNCVTHWMPIPSLEGGE